MNYFFSCKQFVAVMLATGLCCFAAMAQEQAPSAMTLHDCMEYAVSNSTKMRIQQAAIGDAQIDRRDAALALFTLRSVRRPMRTTTSAAASTRRPIPISTPRRSIITTV